MKRGDWLCLGCRRRIKTKEVFKVHWNREKNIPEAVCEECEKVSDLMDAFGNPMMVFDLGQMSLKPASDNSYDIGLSSIRQRIR